MELALIISIISLAISVFFSIWNLFLASQNHLLKKNEYLRLKRKDSIIEFDLRPRFEILNQDKNLDKPGYIEEEVDIDWLVVAIKDYRKDRNRHKQNWVSITFVLRNIGKSEINNLYLSWNSPKNTSLFEIKNNEYKYFIDYQHLNYRVLLDKSIKHGWEIRIKINFHKDFVAHSFISAEASIWMFDEYNNIWEQPLFVHNNRIYDSTKRNFSEFKNFTDTVDAIKCFENPYLWWVSFNYHNPNCS